jgi:hypothetical protein
MESSPAHVRSDAPRGLLFKRTKVVIVAVSAVDGQRGRKRKQLTRFDRPCQLHNRFCLVGGKPLGRTSTTDDYGNQQFRPRQ